MASKNRVAAFAAALLTPKNIGIAEAIVQQHFDKAMTDKDKTRIRELSDLLTLIESVKAE